MTKLAIVTGANIGLGFETTKALVKEDIKVIMACRNITKAEKSKEEILKEFPNASLDIIKLDLASFSSIKKFANSFLENYNTLDLLINNAGIMARKFYLTEDGLESNVGVNYFGHFLLTNLLFKKLLNTEKSRVVFLSSIAHREAKNIIKDPKTDANFKAFNAYAESKLACLMFSYELQRRLDKLETSTISVCAHPGVSITNIGQSLPKFVLKLQDAIGSFFLSNAKNGIEPTMLAALGKDVKGGDYFGPKGFREVKGKAIKVDSTKLSKNKELAEELWILSEEVTEKKFEV